MSTKTPNKPRMGRPSAYKEEYAMQALKLTLLGATDKELADFFGVRESTLNNWKKKQPDFLESLKKGKEIADANVASKLYSRAMGARLTVQQPQKLKQITYHENGKKKSETETVRVVDLEVEQPPDTTAIIFWLKNRQPDKWRDRKEVSTDVTVNNELEGKSDEELRKIIEDAK
ncbi:MAG: helix-turn-helix domain-containing protein [Porphyromonadaceae bacterium]|nr:helix-turn-helix domain-containing protein [Porphyromonadaceae bacterium]